MNRLKIYIDLYFALLFLPLMIIIYPVERWFHNFPTYTICAGIWLYLLYALNRFLTVPLLLKRRYVGSGILFLISVVITGLIAGIKLYEPKLQSYDMGFVRHLPAVEQYQQCIWSLFVTVEFFSIAIGTLIEFAAARNRWLLKTVEDLQARELLEEENERIKRELELSVRKEPSPSYIVLKSGYQNVPVDLSEIIVIEAMENYVKVMRRNKPPIIAQTSMKSMEETLEGHGFVRVHRSYIVSRNSIASYNSRELRIATLPDPIPVGRKYASTLHPDNNA